MKCVIWLSVYLIGTVLFSLGTAIATWRDRLNYGNVAKYLLAVALISLLWPAFLVGLVICAVLTWLRPGSKDPLSDDEFLGRFE